MEPIDFLRAMADPTRLRVIVLLHANTELCVCELTHALGLIQPKISRHLAILRDHGMLLDRRQGKWVYYRIHPDLPAWALRSLSAIVEGAAARQPYIADRANLRTMVDRPTAMCKV